MPMIRKMRQEDRDAVLQIWLEGNRSAHPFVPEAYWLSSMPSVRDQLLQAEVYVEEEGSQIRGFVGMVGTYLAGIFVDGRHRSQGIGARLLEYVKERVPAFSLQVYQKNRRAVAFYQREGLEIAAQGTDPETGEAEYTMRWASGQNER